LELAGASPTLNGAGFAGASLTLNGIESQILQRVSLSEMLMSFAVSKRVFLAVFGHMRFLSTQFDAYSSWSPKGDTGTQILLALLIA